MFRKVAIHFLGLLVAGSLFSGNIFACACCAEPGTRIDYKGKTDQFIRDLIGEIKFAEKADIYMTEAGFDMIEGLDPVRKEDEATTGMIDFSSAGVFTGKTWRITLKTSKGLSATYTLPVPLRYSDFKVDIHDRKEMPMGPWLYKELRFEGPVTATGFAKAGIVHNTKYSLVFQGRGNGCNSPEDYTHWRMDIDGPKAGYAFFGALSSGRRDEAEEARAMLDILQ